MAYSLTAISTRRPLDARVLEAVFDASAMPGAIPGATPGADTDAYGAHHGATLLRQQAVRLPTTALPTTALPMALLEARTRGAFLRFLASLLRDLPCFLSVAGAVARAAAEEGAARCDGRNKPLVLAEQLALAEGLDEQLDCFVRAQPAASRPFLRELCRTQLFLCFVQPADRPAEALPTAAGGGEAAGSVGRGGGSSELVRDAHLERELRLRCFELVRDAQFERELRLAALRERQHGSLPTSVEWEAIGAAHHGAVHHGTAHHGADPPDRLPSHLDLKAQAAAVRHSAERSAQTLLWGGIGADIDAEIDAEIDALGVHARIVVNPPSAPNTASNTAHGAQHGPQGFPLTDATVVVSTCMQGVPLTDATVDDFDVPLPRVRPGTPDHRVYGADTEVWPQIVSGAPSSSASSSGEGFTYPEGAIPIELPHNLWASHAPAPPFAPAVASARTARARLTPNARATWSAALVELEARHAKRVGAQLAASAVGGGIVVGGAVAASMLGCSVQ